MKILPVALMAITVASCSDGQIGDEDKGSRSDYSTVNSDTIMPEDTVSKDHSQLKNMDSLK